MKKQYKEKKIYYSLSIIDNSIIFYYNAFLN